MTTKREKILQKLNPKFLKMTPKLSGEAGPFIDLDSDDSLVSGAKQLMIRFFRNQDLCEKNKRVSLQNETELTISSAKYNDKDEICELVTERLSVPFEMNEEDINEKPGRRLQKLKMELQEKMSAKWEEEYKKRVSKNKINSESKPKRKEYEKDQEESDEDEDKDEDDLDDSSQQKASQSKDSEEEVEIVNLNDGDDGDDADVEFDSDEENDDDDDDDVSFLMDKEKSKGNCGISQENNFEKDDDYDNCSLIPAYQPGGGMLYGGSELTQCDEGLPQNLLSPSLKFSINDSSEFKISESTNEPTPKKLESNSGEELENLFTAKTKLFSQNPNDSFDLNDAFEFCSGKFPEDKPGLEESQNSNKAKTDDGDHDSSDADDNDEDDEDDVNDVNDITNKFEDSQEDEDNDAEIKSEKHVAKNKKNIIVFQDSEDEEELTKEADEVEEFQAVPLKLLSDEEEELLGEKQKTKKKRTLKSLNFSDEEDTSNDCKSEGKVSEEENEISDVDLEEEIDDQRSVHYDSEENEINPKEFFEKEAELSGSEWSGDEDERGLDEFDIEEGDAECLDNDEVRSQLEKIHIRRILDDDAREVRLIQEILFEDGDLHSDGKRRDRKFKWKNLGAFDEQENEGAPKEEGGNDSEDDGAEEEKLRKMRHEKELFLMSKKKNGDLSSDDEIVEDFHSVKVTTIKNSSKLFTKDNNKIENFRSVSDITEISKGFSSTRGSFLTRNEEFLSRLAKATSGVTDNILGPKNSKHFVFMTKSPEKGNFEKNVMCKRQVEDSESCTRREKKIKLLPPEIDTGPSILDLLV